MTKENIDQCYFSASRLAGMEERRHVHQYNDNAVRLTRTIGDLAGLMDMGLHLVRIEPGNETTEFHYHDQDEEFVYLLEGEAEARLGEETVIMKAGDMMLFPKGGPAHAMRNAGTSDVVYLMGGTRPAMDVCTYPDLQRRQYRIDGQKEWADLSAFTKVGPPQK